VNLVDSCGWLEYLADGRNAEFYARPLGDVKRLVVPAVCVYEVFRKVLAERGGGRGPAGGRPDAPGDSGAP
jgi:hypothetical protein